jgi:hypothetical protein
MGKYLMISVLLFVVLLWSGPGDGARAGVDIADSLAAAIADTLNGLIGNEFLPGPESFTVPLFPFPDLNITVSLLGYAFAEPLAPSSVWAAPDPNPPPGKNCYHSVNNVQVAVSLSPDETTATVSITIPVLFLDLETLRDRHTLCGESSGPQVFGEQYVMALTGVSGTLEIVNLGDCLQASVVPGSVHADVTMQSFDIRYDTCLQSYKSTIESAFMQAVADGLDVQLEDALAQAMAYFNDLCIVPVESATWGAVKERYRDRR